MDQLGEICQAFFLSREGMDSVALVDRIAERLADEVDTAKKDVTINLLLRQIRSSHHNSNRLSPAVRNLQPRLLHRIHSYFI